MANFVFDTIRSSAYLNIVLLYECPRMTHYNPKSLRCLGEVYPVYAPKL